MNIENYTVNSNTAFCFVVDRESENKFSVFLQWIDFYVWFSSFEIYFIKQVAAAKSFSLMGMCTMYMIFSAFSTQLINVLNWRWNKNLCSSWLNLFQTILQLRWFHCWVNCRPFTIRIFILFVFHWIKCAHTIFYFNLFIISSISQTNNQNLSYLIIFLFISTIFSSTLMNKIVINAPIQKI